METFSEKVKNEICLFAGSQKNKEIVLLIILKTIGEYDLNGVYEFKTRYPFVIRLIHKICEEFKWNIQILTSNQKTLKDKKTNYLLKIQFINNPNLIELTNFLEFIKQKNSSKISLILIGLFLSIGSISGWKKNLHLEFRCDNSTTKKILFKSLNFFNLFPKTIIRHNKEIIYFKRHQEISDFLKVIGAHSSMYQLEDKIIESDYFINLQRLINLDVSNIKKTTKAAVEQWNICKIIKTSIFYNELNEREKLYCEIRSKNKETNMTEICELMNQQLPKDKKISKGGLSHIVKKFKKIYELI